LIASSSFSVASCTVSMTTVTCGNSAFSRRVVATLVGMVMNFSGLDPIKALYWSAVLNGIVAVPVMVMMMMMAARSDIMGRFVVAGALKWLGWIATAVMAAAVVAMLVTSF